MKLYSLTQTIISRYYDTEDWDHENPSDSVESIKNNFEGLFGTKEYLLDFLKRRHNFPYTIKCDEITFEDKENLMFYVYNLEEVVINDLGGQEKNTWKTLDIHNLSSK